MKSFFTNRLIRAAGMAGGLLIAAWGLGASTIAVAGSTSCGTNGDLCSFFILADGAQVGSGRYIIGEGGALQIASPVSFTLDDGSTVGVTGVSGNADPVLGFNASAATTGSGHSFAFSFDLPISLSGPINANSSISYSLTSTTAAGAEIKPLLPGGKVLTAQEVDTTVGGLDSLDKGVSAGNTFSFLGGPATNNSPVFTASNSFIGNSAYDTMNALVAFSLSPNSNVGLSGFVQQELAPVPEPSTTALMIAGLGLVGWIARRRLSS